MPPVPGLEREDVLKREEMPLPGLEQEDEKMPVSGLEREEMLPVLEREMPGLEQEDTVRIRIKTWSRFSQTL